MFSKIKKMIMKMIQRFQKKTATLSKMEILETQKKQKVKPVQKKKGRPKKN